MAVSRLYFLIRITSQPEGTESKKDVITLFGRTLDWHLTLQSSSFSFFWVAKNGSFLKPRWLNACWVTNEKYRLRDTSQNPADSTKLQNYGRSATGRIFSQEKGRFLRNRRLFVIQEKGASRFNQPSTSSSNHIRSVPPPSVF